MRTIGNLFKYIGVLALSLFVSSASVCVLECRAFQQQKESHGCCPVSKKNSPTSNHHSETSVCSVTFLSDSASLKINHEIRIDGFIHQDQTEIFDASEHQIETIDLGQDPVPKFLFKSLKLPRSPPL